MAKEVINFRRVSGGLYKVESLTNRLEPTVGNVLRTNDVENLIEQAKLRLPECPLTINIKAS
jgi:hypothetical protein